jgi:hypothetical protein
MVDVKVSSQVGISGASTTDKTDRIGESSELAFRAVSQQLRGLSLSGFSLDQPLAKARALSGKADIEGPRAQDVANALNFLYARSRKFRSWVDDEDEASDEDEGENQDQNSRQQRRKNRRKKRNKYMVRTTFGDTDSFASIGQDEETVLLNLSQIKGTQYGLVGLVAHEFGHAAGGFKDGAPGKVGPNQIAQAQVLAEAGVGDGGVLPYGQDLGGKGTKIAYYVMMS